MRSGLLQLRGRRFSGCGDWCFDSNIIHRLPHTPKIFAYGVMSWRGGPLRPPATARGNNVLSFHHLMVFINTISPGKLLTLRLLYRAARGIPRGGKGRGAGHCIHHSRLSRPSRAPQLPVSSVLCPSAVSPVRTVHRCVFRPYMSRIFYRSRPPHRTVAWQLG